MHKRGLEEIRAIDVENLGTSDGTVLRITERSEMRKEAVVVVSLL